MRKFTYRPATQVSHYQPASGLRVFTNREVEGTRGRVGIHSKWCLPVLNSFINSDCSAVVPTHGIAIVGIDKIESTSDKTIVYPNPAVDGATFLLAELGTEAQLIIRDITGRIYLQELVNSGVEVDLSSSDLPGGLYFYEIKQEQFNTSVSGSMVILK